MVDPEEIEESILKTRKMCRYEAARVASGLEREFKCICTQKCELVRNAEKKRFGIYE